MKYWLVMIPIVFFSLVQAVFLPVNLVLLAVVIWAALRPGRQVYPVAFVSGVALDLAMGQTLGVSSLLFLVFSFLVQMYARRFDLVHPLVPAFMVFLFNMINSLAMERAWLVEGVWLAVLALAASPLLRRVKREEAGLRLGVPR